MAHRDTRVHRPFLWHYRRVDSANQPRRSTGTNCASGRRLEFPIRVSTHHGRHARRFLSRSRTIIRIRHRSNASAIIGAQPADAIRRRVRADSRQPEGTAHLLCRAITRTTQRPVALARARDSGHRRTPRHPTRWDIGAQPISHPADGYHQHARRLRANGHGHPRHGICVPARTLILGAPALRTARHAQRLRPISYRAARPADRCNLVSLPQVRWQGVGAPWQSRTQRRPRRGTRTCHKTAPSGNRHAANRRAPDRSRPADNYGHRLRVPAVDRRNQRIARRARKRRTVRLSF